MPAAKSPSSEGSGKAPFRNTSRRPAARVATVLTPRGLSVGSAFPIADYDELTVAEVEAKLPGLTAPQLRKIRDYERSHANRKSVLAAVEKLLD